MQDLTEIKNEIGVLEIQQLLNSFKFTIVLRETNEVDFNTFLQFLKLFVNDCKILKVYTNTWTDKYFEIFFKKFSCWNGHVRIFSCLLYFYYLAKNFETRYQKRLSYIN